VFPLVLGLVFGNRRHCCHRIRAGAVVLLDGTLLGVKPDEFERIP